MVHLNWYARNYVYVHVKSTSFIVTDKGSKVKRARLSETFVFRVERETSILLLTLFFEGKEARPLVDQLPQPIGIYNLQLGCERESSLIDNKVL